MVTSSQLTARVHFMIGIINAYFEVQFHLQTIADGDRYVAADRITVINGAHGLIKYLMIKSAGKIVYDTDHYNVTFAKNLLEYSNDYSRSVAKNSLWYLDTNNTTANTNTGFEARKHKRLQLML